MIEDLFAARLKNTKVNIIREITKKTVQPGFISFAGGNPSPDTFPVEGLAEAAQLAVRTKKLAALQYGVTAGYVPLRQLIADELKKKGIHAEVENILVTTGSQQGIELIAKAFLEPEDGVVMEDPTYVAALQIFRLYRASFSTVAIGSGGLDVEGLRSVCGQKKHKILYSVPTFQNPTGFTMCEETREKLPGIMEENDMVMIEDDPYGDLYYGERPPNPVKAHDTYGRVIYLGSFSKTVAPGLRVGYVVAAPEIIRRLEVAKQSSDLQGCGFSQVTLHEYLSNNDFARHLSNVRELYKKKCGAMYELMLSSFPEWVKVYKPQGGLFLWCELPESMDAYALLEKAMEQKVAFIPAASFYVGGNVHNTMRFNFSNAAQEQMERGISIIGDLLDKI